MLKPNQIIRVQISIDPNNIFVEVNANSADPVQVPGWRKKAFANLSGSVEDAAEQIAAILATDLYAWATWPTAQGFAHGGGVNNGA